MKKILALVQLGQMVGVSRLSTVTREHRQPLERCF